MIETDKISEFSVQVEGDTVMVVRPDHTAYSINLKKVTQVFVETNEGGPWGLDVWFVLLDETSGNAVTYPLGAVGEDAVLERLLKFDGFELKGMDSTDNATHLCWSKYPIS